MVLPGWNVTEPIDLAYKLYEFVESLRSAPESAKAFNTKISNFTANLKELLRVLENDKDSHSAQDLDHLRTTVLECQAIVQRCQEYGEGFAKITKDGRGKMDGAGQAARWTLQEKKVARLREEIDGLMSSIGLTLAIRTFADGRTRQGSHSTTENSSPPLRSGTFPTLPPYSSPQPNWAQPGDFQHAKTPADYLGLDTNHNRRTSDTDTLEFHIVSYSGNGNGSAASPQISPNTLRPLAEQDWSSDHDPPEAAKPLERRRDTIEDIAMSPTGLGKSNTSSDGSRPASRVFTSPALSPPDPSMTEVTYSTQRRDSIIPPEFAVLEMKLENLNGVQASYYKVESRISYPISMIESFRNKQNGRRCIIISPPTSFNTKLYFVPPTERIIPHSEHPQAYGSTTKYRVKFIEPYLLRSQKTSSERRSSDASLVLSPSLALVSSAASVASSRSLGSSVLTINSGELKEESRRHEYDFENVEDYRRFQELLMGPDVKLQLQVPVQSIMAKKYEKKLHKESQLQYLRLWQSGGRQTLMFFANLSTGKYREYRMETLRPVESKSKTTIRLDVHLPGTVRRKSSSRSPLIIAKASTQEQARFGAYTDDNDMVDLDYLLIEFGCAKDRTTFLNEARFHGSVEEPIASPHALLSKSPL